MPVGNGTDYQTQLEHLIEIIRQKGPISERVLEAIRLVPRHAPTWRPLGRRYALHPLD